MDADGEAPVGIEITVEAGDWPPVSDLQGLASKCISAAYETVRADGVAARNDYVVSLLFTNDHAIRELNRTWRGRDRATNVLSFPQSGRVSGMLGDIVLAYETVHREAALEGKPFDHHIAHLIVHGFLHLFGYDHEHHKHAERMEHLERSGLKKIGISDPYAAAVVNDD